MPTAKRLPSGTWRVRVYSHKNPDGTQKYESFTAPTKKEAEYLAAQWQREPSARPEDLSVQDAVIRYIDTNTPVLSPSTVRKYRAMLRAHFGLIGSVSLRRLTSEQAQSWVSSLSLTLNPKTVSCVYGLLTAALSQLAPDLTLHVKLPRRIPREISIPTANVLSLLISEAPEDFRPALVIASSMGLRRAEISALTWSDVRDGKLHITRAYVQGTDKVWVLRAPKTNAGIRSVPIPPVALPYLTPPPGASPDDRIVPLTPDAITRRFERLTARLHLPGLRFHSLRHYYDSVLLSLGVPDKYIMARMGHATPSMTKQVYSHVMKDKDAQITDTINEYFSEKK